MGRRRVVYARWRGVAERKAAAEKQAKTLEAQRRAALLLSDNAWDEGRAASSHRVSKWSAGQVVEWFEGTFRWADRYVEHLQLAGIDGESLLAMDDAGLRHDLKVRNVQDVALRAGCSERRAEAGLFALACSSLGRWR
jgi:hypothetical protein